MKKNLLLIAILLVLISCKEKFEQPTILEKNCGFDLEHTTFNENIAKMYSKNFINDYEFDMEKEYNPNEKLADTIFRYKISNTVTEVMKFKIPNKEFGYLYKTSQIDSVAKFQKIYFNTIYTLCNTNKKPVAYYVETKFENPKLRKQYLTEFIKTFGTPKYSFLVSHDYNQCSYEWNLEDRTIQIEISFGWEATFSSDGKNNNGKYYRLDMLIIDNKYADAIKKAHILELPDKIMYDGKLHSYKDFQFEKVSNVKDEFLLNSTNEALIKKEFCEYDIENSDKDE